MKVMYSSVEVLEVNSTEPNIRDSPIFLVGLLCPDFAIRVIQLPCMPTQYIIYYCTPPIVHCCLLLHACILLLLIVPQ